MIGGILASMTADNNRDREREQELKDRKMIFLKIENLKMVCRRLAAAKTLATRDKIAKQCYHLFEGDILRRNK